MKKLIIPGLIILSLSIFSCKSYYIPVNSFKSQFTDIDSTSLKPVIVKDPAGTRHVYLANPIDFIYCEDKDGNQHKLQNNPSIEIRFTDYKNKRTVFYFDRVFMNDSVIIGYRSRFAGLKQEIPIKDVIKIEVQDGQKGFFNLER